MLPNALPRAAVDPDDRPPLNPHATSQGAALLLGGGLLAVAGCWPAALWIGPLAARIGSPDGVLQPEGYRSLAWLVAASGLLLVAAGIALAIAGGDALGQLLADEPGTAPPRYRRVVAATGLAVSTAAAHFSLRDAPWYLGELGLLELVQVAVLATAVWWLLRAARLDLGPRSAPAGPTATSVPRWACFLGAVALGAWVGEEISWGQWFFGWETPAAWSVRNHQQETNLHNLFNHGFVTVYAVMAVGLALLAGLGLPARALRLSVSRVAGQVPSRRLHRALARLEPFPLPPPNLLPLALALPIVDLVCRASHRSDVYELLELLVALLAASWAAAIAATRSRAATVAAAPTHGTAHLNRPRSLNSPPAR